MSGQFDLEYFEKRWNESFEKEKSSCLAAWNGRADDWDRKYRKESDKDKPRDARMIDTAEYLRSKGLLGPDCDVADIGCGPGRFTAEFAKTANFVLGTDISPKMADYGAAYCREKGLYNVEFKAVDFINADIKALGWENRFDLVFSSITPAASGKGLDNIIAMSRGWCFNACFVYYMNELNNRILKELFDREPKKDKTSHSQWLYELFNLLWLRGYYPDISYYKQHKEISIKADRNSAFRLADYLLREEELTVSNISCIQKFLEANADKDGFICEVSDCWYGWTLWDVRDRHNHTVE